MKKIIVTCMVLCLVIAFGATNSFAGPSSKASCNAGDLSGVIFNSPGLLFEQTIHTASQKDLFIDVSLECGLTTNTKVMSKALNRAISEAEATVKVWVTVDGEMAAPGEVTFARRTQALIAEFAGSLAIPSNYSWDGSEDGKESCWVTDNDGITRIAEDCLEDEMLALILDTMSANSFDFIKADLDAGDHVVQVWADLLYENTGGEYTDDDLTYLSADEISTRAYLGNGSVTIESVRLVKDDGPVVIE